MDVAEERDMQYTPMVKMSVDLCDGVAWITYY